MKPPITEGHLALVNLVARRFSRSALDSRFPLRHGLPFPLGLGAIPLFYTPRIASAQITADTDRMEVLALITEQPRTMKECASLMGKPFNSVAGEVAN
jgi:hypothetical protein